MGVNHGLVSVEERAKEICRQQTEQLNKKELRIKYKCSPRTVDRVYKLKGWKVDRKKLAQESLQKTPNHKSVGVEYMYRPGGRNLLCEAWV